MNVALEQFNRIRRNRRLRIALFKYWYGTRKEEEEAFRMLMLIAKTEVKDGQQTDEAA